MNSGLPNNFIVRNSNPSDHLRIIKVMKAWWDGRELSQMLPRIFLEHFCNTSFIVEKDNTLVAFLVGFFSQYRMEEGYIHFAGVHPHFRGAGIGPYLYNLFSEVCLENWRTMIKSCTSPVNKASISFHKKMGFQIEKGNSELDGIQVTLDYNKPNDSKVLFKKIL